MDMVKTGQLIAQARKEQGLTQEDLSARLHISNSAVSKWERGLSFPDVQLLEPLSELLGIPVSDLVSGERSIAPPPPYVTYRTGGRQVMHAPEIRREKERVHLETASRIYLSVGWLGFFGILLVSLFSRIGLVVGSWLFKEKYYVIRLFALTLTNPLAFLLTVVFLGLIVYGILLRRRLKKMQ